MGGTLREICRCPNKDYGIFADWRQGGKFLVMAGKGEIHDIDSTELNLMLTTKYFEPEEKKKLEEYLRN